jgi:hypothetical protein
VPFVVEGYQLTGTANVNAAAVTIDPVASPEANTYPLTYSAPISAPERDRPPRSPTSVERQSSPRGATVAR